MCRAVLLPLAFGLAVLTGVALLGTAHALTDSAVTPDRSNANAAVVLRFYDAVNALLQTGSATDLENVLAPDFVDHAERAGVPPTGQGLVRYISGLRVAFPALHLTAEDLVAQRQQVAARVRVEGADHGTYLGLPVDDEVADWGALDVFRIVDDRIVEHWGGRDAPLVLEPLVPSPFVGHLRPNSDAEASSLVMVLVCRWRLEPGARTDAVAAGDTVLVVEEGRIGVRIHTPANVVPIDAMSPEDRDLSSTLPETVIGRGDVLAVPAGTTFFVRNAGGAEAVAHSMALGLSPYPVATQEGPSRAGATPDPKASVWTAEIVGASRLVSLPTSQLAVAAGRVTIAPGGTFVVGPATGLALIGVGSGTLSFEGDNERVAGAFDVLPSTESTVLRNAGPDPLTLFVVTIGQGNPADATATSPE